jgi:Major Facilitator Superfamily
MSPRSAVGSCRASKPWGAQTRGFGTVYREGQPGTDSELLELEQRPIIGPRQRRIEPALDLPLVEVAQIDLCEDDRADQGRSTSLDIAQGTLQTTRRSHVAGLMGSGQLGSLLRHVVVPAVLAGHLIPLWNLSNTQVGLLSACYSTGYMLAVPILTSLTNRIDARKLLLGGSLLGTAASVAFALWADGLLSVTLPWRLAGVGFSGAYMPGLRALTDRLDPREKSRSSRCTPQATRSVSACRSWCPGLSRTRSGGAGRSPSRASDRCSWRGAPWALRWMLLADRPRPAGGWPASASPPPEHPVGHWHSGGVLAPVLRRPCGQNEQRLIIRPRQRTIEQPIELPLIEVSTLKLVEDDRPDEPLASGVLLARPCVMKAGRSRRNLRTRSRHCRRGRRDPLDTGCRRSSVHPTTTYCLMPPDAPSTAPRSRAASRSTRCVRCEREDLHQPLGDKRAGETSRRLWGTCTLALRRESSSQVDKDSVLH